MIEQMHEMRIIEFSQNKFFIGGYLLCFGMYSPLYVLSEEYPLTPWLIFVDCFGYRNELEKRRRASEREVEKNRGLLWSLLLLSARGGRLS